MSSDIFHGMKTIALLLLLVAPVMAKKKPDPYRDSRCPEARTACESRIKYNAKDPDAIRFEHYVYDTCGGMGKTFVVDMDVWGRNTFGAVLKHPVKCIAKCKEGTICKVTDVYE